MSSMPESDMPGGWGGGGTQQGTSSHPGYQGTPGHEQFGSVPSGGGHQGGYPGDPYGSGRGEPGWGQPGWGQPGWGSPVHQDETKVVGRRVVQYVIDYVLVGIIPAIAYWLLDRGSGFLHGFGWTIATLISLVVYLWYWVLRPRSHHGQSFGMQLLGVRVISKDGGPANMLQLFVRGVLLIVDTFLFGLVGLVTMMVSRYHQRVGDHMARTLVVGTGYGSGGMGGGQDQRTSTYGAEDERLARRDMYSEDRYGAASPDMGAADADAGGRRSGGRGGAELDREVRREAAAIGNITGWFSEPVPADSVFAGVADRAGLGNQQVEVVDGLADRQHLVHQVEVAEPALPSGPADRERHVIGRGLPAREHLGHQPEPLVVVIDELVDACVGARRDGAVRRQQAHVGHPPHHVQ